MRMVQGEMRMRIAATTGQRALPARPYDGCAVVSVSFESPMAVSMTDANGGRLMGAGGLTG